MCMNCGEYKSPSHKLIKFFKKSRDSWEKVAKKRRDEIRDFKARVRDLETSRNLWKERAKLAVDQVKAKALALQNVQKELIKIQIMQVSLQLECEEFKKKHL